MSSFDLNEYWNSIAPSFKKRVVTVTLQLTREQICDALKYDFVLLDGQYYSTPTDQLIHVLRNELFYAQNEYELIQYEY